MKLTKSRNRQLSKIYNKIVAHYGPSKFQDWTPDLNVYYNPTHLCQGEWEYLEAGCEVSLNMALVHNMRHAVKVLIHEYIHHLQSPSWYTRYEQMYGYWKNPYEINAWEIAKRDVGLFWPPKE